MMAAIFASLTAAWVAASLSRRDLSLMALALCLALSIWLFLFEIYSPEYGFRMPWIQTFLDGPGNAPT